MKITTNYILILFTYMCFYNNVYSQTKITEPSNDLDNQYTPKGNGPLFEANKSSNKGSSSKHSSDDYPKNIVKITPTLFLRNIALFNYEHNVSKNVSVIGGIGFNYNKDGIFSALGSEFNFSSENANKELSMSETLSGSTHESPSICINLAPKFMFEQYWGDGYNYIQLDFMHYANNMTYSTAKASNNVSLIGSPNVKYSHNLFTIKYGAQFHTDSSPITTHDIYFSFGLRSVAYTPINISEVTSSSGSSSYTYNYSVSQNKITKQFFYIGIGYSFGIGF